MRLDKRWWLLVVLVALLALFFGLDLGRFLSLAAIKSSQADLQAWRAAQPLLAGLLFFAGLRRRDGAVAARRRGDDAGRRRPVRPGLGHADRLLRVRLSARRSPS